MIHISNINSVTHSGKDLSEILELIESDTSVLMSSSSVSSSPSSNSNINSKEDGLSRITADFTKSIHDPSLLSKHAGLVAESYNEALQKNSEITMLPNYNISPSGNESGNFLVIDLGGSTLRVAVVQLNQVPGKKINLVLEKKWVVENSNKSIGKEFFKWVGSKIAETLGEQSVIDAASGAVINTGITWSFPLEQTSHNHGLILFMGKGYTIESDAYKKDLKVLLEESLLSNFQINLDVQVLVNDSLAVYAAGTFIDKYMKLAMVLGTGFNLCCALDTTQLHANKRLGKETAVLLNSEASLFGAVLLKDLSTKYDTFIDYRMDSELDLAFSPHMELDVDSTFIQPSEYMTSGRYLPELTRLVLIDLIARGEIFNGISSGVLQELFSKPYAGFEGELMCFISENSNEDDLINKVTATYNWDKGSITKEDVSKLKSITDCIIERAAYIIAAMLIAVIKLTKQHNGITDKQLNIGFVGSVLDYFHKYRSLILKHINGNQDIQTMGLSVDFNSVENSSIVGAAVGAAYFAQQQK